MDSKQAVRVYQLAERLKSELIIANDLIYETSLIKDHVAGGRRILLAYMRGVLREANFAVNASGLASFGAIAQKISSAMDKADMSDFAEASNLTTEALTLSTGEAGRAAEVLLEKGLF